jgi:FAD binding domain
MDVATDTRRTSVFIVGGGPVGLAMGLLLDRFGIDSVIIEKSPTTTDHPKSRGCWVRTMEIFRQWGIEQAIRDRGLQDDSEAAHLFVFISLTGMLGRIAFSGNCNDWDTDPPAALCHPVGLV